ncbi:The {Largely Archaeal Putative} Hydrophobe/Amphiphile Efflux-3 {HAE3} Family [Geoglobus ahangari]|uniref:The (Largely Archaeal Putative) Hydrophobe/Amphiphile Efflux-3 (HAE3) Family n=1 Tax=Geoglobus ahangari TaxID=113653 RepID=A0A0F7IFX7_9EURY|nr:RND family transporter [Geoglobus ahangari]AKG92458.1 The {Largely Archaeal Putative} Hydrophobe/Amphiphile Efflux-3 {HAE3} Family [Geoglobus ahangari]
MKALDLLSSLVVKGRYAIIVIVVLAFLLASYNTQNIQMNQGYETYFSKDYKEYQQYTLFSKKFGGGVASIFVFIKGDDVVNYETFDFALKLGREISKVDGIGRVKSPAHTVVNVLGYLPADENKLKEIAYEYGAFYIPKKSLMLMEFEVTADESQYNRIAKEVEERIAELNPPPGVTVEATGNPMIRYQIEESIGQSMRVMGGVAVLLMVITLVVVFRGVVEHKKYLLLPLLVSILTATLAFGLMPLLGIPLTEVTNAIAPILIGLSIEYAAQFMGRYEEERRKGLSVVEASVISIKSVGLALSLAMITTVIGFLSMVFSGVPALGWFGIVSAIGLVIAYLLSITLLPAIMLTTDRSERKRREEEGVPLTERLLDTASLLSARHYKIVLLATLIITSASYFGYSKVPLQTDFMKYVPQDLPAMRKFNELQSLVGSQDRIIAVFQIDSFDPDTIKEFEELASYVLNSEQNIIDYSSLGKILKMQFGSIPETSYELEKELARIGDDRVSSYLSGSSYAIYFTVAPMDWLEFRDLYERVTREIKFYGSDSPFFLTGDVVLKMFVADIIVNGQNKMTLASFALVFMLLLFVYRSPRKAIVPIIPITVVILVNGGLMYVLGYSRTLVTASLNSLTIGLGIDFSIHVMERYFEERRRGLSPERAVEITITNIGKPILTSGLTMAGGFAAMLASPFPIMSDFGVVSLMAILLSLLAALTVVPAFLVFTDNLNKTEKVKSGEEA